MIIWQSGMKITPARLAHIPRGIIARGKRTTNSTGTTTSIAVLRIDDVPIYAGRAYVVHVSSVAGDSGTANDVPRAEIRYTTDGSTPTTASTLLPAALWQYVQPNTTHPTHSVITSEPYVPGSDQTFSVVVCAVRQSGSGTITLNADSNAPLSMWIEDIGIDPGDTGVDL